MAGLSFECILQATHRSVRRAEGLTGSRALSTTYENVFAGTNTKLCEYISDDWDARLKSKNKKKKLVEAS